MVELDLATVFDAEPVACAVISPDLEFVAVNRAYERLAGPRERLIGRRVFDVLPGGADGRNAAHWRTALEWVLAEGQPYVMPWGRYDAQVPGRPGVYEKRYWSTVNAPLLDDDGRVSLIIHRIEDVTAFIEQLREERPYGGDVPPDLLKVEVELYVRGRELQSVNHRLRQAQREERETAAELRETVRRQRQEVADASHDLRNPLAGLQTRLEAALAEPDVDSRQVLHAALQDAERLSDIVSDLLELARLDSGAPVTTEPVDLCELACDILTGHTCALTLDTSFEPPAVVAGSRSRLLRLFGNLLANAERHARTRIEVSVACDHGDAVLQIADDGPGIPEDERQAVFRRFYRRADARRADPDGTGLGLAIARQTARAHRGTLQIADRTTGTCMVLRIPLQPAA
ncbi:PAS domain-containing sensor histidine kinase [Actinomadura verrucosospora]|uniref:histidine kinase n=1 Tax=Actinomadura verrucosospora TaxID=46165 RepID=A0A7D4AX66_ACTVE|nr:PAS domain-containing sensor histidine kinase [Actinomadura verrucosospora]QKG27029.1 two-component hybrid sensor and regulator [Actinomadura verrucosospora]